MGNGPRVVIVGGGVASLIAGIEIRDRLPDAELDLYAAEPEPRMGGHLASWDEDGFPIEHGLHALFGFYDNILPMLKRVGAEQNFTRSHAHTYVYERRALHRFQPSTWFANYTGFTTAEKLAMTRFLPRLARILTSVRRHGLDALDAYDRYDMREFGREHGLPESVVRSNFFRQFYDAPFNEPEPLSAAIALEALYQIFSRPWHYYFNLPSKESLIDPLARYFTDVCGGRIHSRSRAGRLCYSPSGDRVTAIEIRSTPAAGKQGASRPRRVPLDELVLAVGLEDFKALDLGAPATGVPYFERIRSLRTVSSVSLQAWFKRDPVPKGLDSLIGGLPEPLSILSPLSRVRPAAGLPRSSSTLLHEIAVCGPEAGFEGQSDGELASRLFQTLNEDCGFRIPLEQLDDPQEMHVRVRRNQDPAHRYLLTLPGDLALRPSPQSPIENLCLAGAWVRNRLALPCVDSAAESGRAVAEAIATRAHRLVAPLGAIRTLPPSGAPRLRGMPAGHGLVLPPPFEFRDVMASLFFVDARAQALAELLPPELTLVPGFRARLLLAVFDHREVFSPADPSQSLYRYREVLLAAVAHPRAIRAHRGYGLHPLCLYVDNDVAAAAGREVYGFPKKLAEVSLSDRGFQVTRAGRPPGVTGEGWQLPIQILEGTWKEARATAGAPGMARAIQATMKMPFYNCLELPPATPESQTPQYSRLNRMPITGLKVHTSRLLRDATVQIRPSLVDPIYRLSREPDRLVFQAQFGVRLHCRFVMAAAEPLIAQEQPQPRRLRATGSAPG